MQSVSRSIGRRLAPVTIVFGFAAAPAVAETILVPSVTYPNIQAALDGAQEGDRVVVLDGTYTGAGNCNLDFGGKKLFLRSLNGPEGCIIDCEGAARAFYFHTGETSESMIGGFTIRNGYTNGLGGAILCESASPMITDCRFESNIAESVGPGTGNGGAIYALDSSPQILDSVFVGNMAITPPADPTPFFDGSGLGGAMFFKNGSNGTIERCEFQGNMATSPGLGGNGIGGAIFVTNSNPGDPEADPPVDSVLPSLLIVTDTSFIDNTASIAGGAIWVQGVESAPVLPLYGPSSLTITGSTFTGNSAQSGGAVAAFSFADVSIDQSQFTGNWTVEELVFFLPDVQAGIGGGALGFVLFSTVEIANSMFMDNQSLAGYGGAFSNSFGNIATVTNCQFIENHAALAGGGVANHALTAFGGGAPATLEVVDSLFMANTTDLHGAGLATFDGSTLVLQGTDFEANLAESIGFGTGNAAGLYAAGGLVTATGTTFTGNMAVTPPADPTPLFDVSGLGGAVMITRGCNATFDDCTFTGNMATSPGLGGNGFGGAIFVAESRPGDPDAEPPVEELLPNTVTVLNSVFDDNVASIGGGAVWVQGVDSAPVLPDFGPSVLTIEGTQFNGNSGQSGGAIAGFSFAVITIESSQFIGNWTFAELPFFLPGVQEGLGGGAFGAGLFCTATIVDCRFLDNTSLAGSGGALSNTFGNAARVINSEFRGNTAALEGGAIANHGLTAFFGGAPASMEVANSLFACNSTGLQGGAIANFAMSTLSLVNSTVVDNDAAMVGGVANLSGTVAVGNSILYGNTPAQLSGGSMSTALFSIIEGGWSGAGNLDVDPLFLDPDGPDGDPLTCDDNDYRLLSGSPAIDAGHNWAVPRDVLDLDGDGNTGELLPLDLLGGPRFRADAVDFDPGCGLPVVVDMGSYEFEFGPGVEIIYADLTGDGVVDVADLVVLVLQWGLYEEDCRIADLDLSGEVDVSDMVDLILNWS